MQPIRGLTARIVNAHLFTTLIAIACLTSCTPAKNFEPIFNGKNLDGWHGMNFDPRKLATMSAEERAARRAADMTELLKHWRVDDGIIVNDGEGPYLTTDREYGDMEVLIEYKTVPIADSGIYLRGTPQVQIWDSTNESISKIGGDKGSGGLWNNSPGAAGKDPLVLADAPFGTWNRFRILQIGARTSVHLNDKLVVDHAIMENYWDREKPLFPRGPIQLQTHGGEICWRNIRIREIDAAEANRTLSERDSDGFTDLFNGKDLSGWEGAVGEYMVTDGVVQCKKGTGSHLYTANQYSDFVVRLEFRLPPGGNNGLAIRHPGGARVDSSQHAMCELQILDNSAEMYAELDPRQYHGSAYGMVPAHRGYQRPVGEWNFQEVTVKGSTIRVELNGTVILDCDLGKLESTMNSGEHPGRTRTSGHFGFAGHSSPVEFRNVRLKEL